MQIYIYTQQKAYLLTVKKEREHVKREYALEL